MDPQSTTESSSKSFRFLDLPPEIRNQIYCHLLCFDSVRPQIDLRPIVYLTPLCCASPNNARRPSTMRVDTLAFPSSNRGETPLLSQDVLAILSTCQQICSEATPIFWARNRFVLDCPTCIYYFLRRVGLERCQLITKIGTNRWPGMLRELWRPDNLPRQPVSSLQPLRPPLSGFAWHDFDHANPIIRMLTQPVHRTTTQDTPSSVKPPEPSNPSIPETSTLDDDEDPGALADIWDDQKTSIDLLAETLQHCKLAERDRAKTLLQGWEIEVERIAGEFGICCYTWLTRPRARKPELEKKFPWSTVADWPPSARQTWERVG